MDCLRPENQNQNQHQKENQENDENREKHREEGNKMARAFTKNERGKVAEIPTPMESKLEQETIWNTNTTAAISVQRNDVEDAQDRRLWKFGTERRQQL